MPRFRLFGERQPDPADPSEAVSRTRRLRSRRIVIGLWFDFVRGELQGASLSSRGCGRWIEFSSGETQTWSPPEALQQELRRLRGEASPRKIEIDEFRRDMAEWAAVCTQSLLDRLGPIDDEMLAICVHDSGWKLQGYDDLPCFVNWLEPSRLAELSGQNVIADLRVADVMAGGQGEPLGPLAAWFLLGDRSPKTASNSRVLMSSDDGLSLTYLPASDGLDAEHPAIEVHTLTCWSTLVEYLLDGHGMGADEPGIGQRAVQGKEVEALRLALDSLRPSVVLRESGVEPTDLTDALSAWAADTDACRLDIARTLVEWVVDQAVSMCQRQRPGTPPVKELWISGPLATDGFVVKLLSERLPDVEIASLADIGWQPRVFEAAVTTVLGFLHIDQQPASLPWLTQADHPRLHGTLFPGRLSAWRKLLVEMADYRPPPMKLRDAV